MRTLRKPIVVVVNPERHSPGATFKSSLRQWQARWKTQRGPQGAPPAKVNRQEPPE
jgi:hypothetical protein